MSALTWDATYCGEVLTSTQYAAHIRILERAVTRPVFASEAEGPWDNHVAWCALVQSGVISDRAEPGWYRLTEHGLVYAEQRGIVRRRAS